MSEQLDAYRTTGSSPPTRAKVARICLAPRESRGVGEAVDALGRSVFFKSDWRTLLAIAAALRAGQSVGVILEGWQLLAFWRVAR